MDAAGGSIEPVDTGVVFFGGACKGVEGKRVCNAPGLGHRTPSCQTVFGALSADQWIGGKSRSSVQRRFGRSHARSLASVATERAIVRHLVAGRLMQSLSPSHVSPKLHRPFVHRTVFVPKAGSGGVNVGHHCLCGCR